MIWTGYDDDDKASFKCWIGVKGATLVRTTLRDAAPLVFAQAVALILANEVVGSFHEALTILKACLVGMKHLTTKGFRTPSISFSLHQSTIIIIIITMLPAPYCKGGSQIKAKHQEKKDTSRSG